MWQFSKLNLLSALMALTLCAGNTSTAETTIESVVREVVSKNPELKNFEYEIAAAKGEHLTASAWENPEFGSSMGNKRANSDGDSANGLAFSVEFQQTIEWPGRIELREAIAKKQIQLAEIGLSQFKLILAARARSLAYQLSSMQELAQSARRIANRFSALRETLSKRNQAGINPLLEIRIIESTELTTERMVTEAELSAEHALLELNQLRGASWKTPLSLKPRPLTFSPLLSTDTLIAAAQENNFEIQIQKLTAEQQSLKVSLAKNERNPNIKVGPYFSRERASDTEYQVGVGFSIPLPIWNRNAGKIASEDAKALRASNSLNLAQKNIEREILENVSLYQRKLKEMERWKPEAITKFREATELAEENYRLGSVPISTYVELQKQYLEATEALMHTAAEALAAQQELQKLTGLQFLPTPANPLN